MVWVPPPEATGTWVNWPGLGGPSLGFGGAGLEINWEEDEEGVLQVLFCVYGKTEPLYLERARLLDSGGRRGRRGWRWEKATETFFCPITPPPMLAPTFSPKNGASTFSNCNHTQGLRPPGGEVSVIFEATLTITRGSWVSQEVVESFSFIPHSEVSWGVWVWVRQRSLPPPHIQSRPPATPRISVDP